MYVVINGTKFLPSVIAATRNKLAVSASLPSSAPTKAPAMARLEVCDFRLHNRRAKKSPGTMAMAAPNSAAYPSRALLTAHQLMAAANPMLSCAANKAYARCIPRSRSCFMDIGPFWLVNPRTPLSADADYKELAGRGQLFQR